MPYRRKRHYGRGRLRLLPLLLIFVCVLCVFHALGQPEQQQNAPQEPPFVQPKGGPVITVLMPDGRTQEWAMEEFLVGVVAAEMPASFSAEALKAQAIAARTYVLSHSQAADGIPRHNNADICCDSTHCQAYLTTEQMQKRWGEERFAENYQVISRAVGETTGLAIFYAGKLVETPYCSTCGGSTQAAADVWGQDMPYLQPVPCYWDSHSPRAVSTLELSLAEAANRLAVKPSALTAMSASYSTGGAVSSLAVGTKTLGGQEMRQALGLDSAACQWLIQNERILFTTRGFGHGVGLCQYGADGLAKAGHTAQQILTYYYQGTEVAPYT